MVMGMRVLHQWISHSALFNGYRTRTSTPRSHADAAHGIGHDFTFKESSSLSFWTCFWAGKGGTKNGWDDSGEDKEVHFV